MKSIRLSTILSTVMLLAIVACTSNSPAPTQAATQSTRGAGEVEPGPTMAGLVMPPAPDTPQVAPEGGTSEPLSANGPWLVFTDTHGVWAANADGSGAIRLTDLPVVGASRPLAAAGHGRHVAFITSSSAEDRYFHLRLMLMTLPSGEVKEITPLTSATTEPPLDAEPSNQSLEIARAIVDLDNLAWSPDGRRLAFTGAQDGPSVDVYGYSLDDGKIKRLTNNPSQDIRPSWSPDGRYIVHAGVNGLGAGASFSMQGVWATATDGSASQSLYDPQDSGDEIWLGWTRPDTFLVYSFNVDCGYRNLRTFTIPSKSEHALWPDALTYAAYDPVSKHVLLAVNDTPGNCHPPDQAGLYLVGPDLPEPQPAGQGEIQRLIWSSEARLFFAQDNQGVRSITATGQVAQLAAPEDTMPVAAPDGKTLAWVRTPLESPDGLWIGPIGQSQPAQVFDNPVRIPMWSPDSRYFLFFNDDGLSVASQSDFKPILRQPGVQALEAVWVVP